MENLLEWNLPAAFVSFNAFNNLTWWKNIKSLLRNLVTAYISKECVPAQLLKSCLTICDPMDCSPPGSSVHGIFQARLLEWVAISSSRRSSQPREWTCISWVSCITGKFFSTESPRKPCINKTSLEILLFYKERIRTNDYSLKILN